MYFVDDTLERYKINQKHVYFSQQSALSVTYMYVYVYTCVRSRHYYRQEHRHSLSSSSGEDKGVRGAGCD